MSLWARYPAGRVLPRSRLKIIIVPKKIIFENTTVHCNPSEPIVLFLFCPIKLFFWNLDCPISIFFGNVQLESPMPLMHLWILLFLDSLHICVSEYSAEVYRVHRLTNVLSSLKNTETTFLIFLKQISRTI